MKIYLNYPTGNFFPDGMPEVGKVDPFDVNNMVDLDSALDTIPDEYYGLVFITDENEEVVTLEDLIIML